MNHRDQIRLIRKGCQSGEPFAVEKLLRILINSRLTAAHFCLLAAADANPTNRLPQPMFGLNNSEY